MIPPTAHCRNNPYLLRTPRRRSPMLVPQRLGWRASIEAEGGIEVYVDGLRIQQPDKHPILFIHPIPCLRRAADGYPFNDAFRKSFSAPNGRNILSG